MSDHCCRKMMGRACILSLTQRRRGAKGAKVDSILCVLRVFALKCCANMSSLRPRRWRGNALLVCRAGILPANVGVPLVGSRSEALPAGGYETLPYIFADPMTAFDKRTVKAHNFLCRRELHNFRPRTPPKNVTCQQNDGSR